MLDSILSLTSNDFNEKAIKSNSRVVIFFFAKWSGACRLMSEILIDVIKHYNINPIGSSKKSKGIIFFKINVDDEKKVSSQLGIIGTPCFICINDGKIIDTKNGVFSADNLIKWLNSVFKE